MLQPPPLTSDICILTSETVEIVASPRGFDPVTSRVVTRLPAGLSVAEMTARIEPNPVRRRAMLAYIGPPCRDNYLPRAWHGRVRPHGGQRVHLVAPMGDDDFFRIFVQLAALSVAVFVPAPFGPFLAFGLSLGVTALIPPPRQDTGAAEGLRRRPLVTGFRNRLDPWGVIPWPLGRIRITPPFLAEPYRFTRGEHQWFSLVFAVLGPVELDDFRFGQTSVDRFERVEVRYTKGFPESPLDFTAADIAPDSNRIRLTGHPYVWGNEVRFKTSGTLDSALATGTRYWVVSRTRNAIKVAASRGGVPVNLQADGSGSSTVFRRERRPRLYPGQVFADEFNITLEEGVRHVRTTPAEVDRASVIFFFPQGLGKFDDKSPGDIDPQTVLVEVQFTETGTGNWRPLDQDSYPARNAPRTPRPRRIRKRIDESFTLVPSIATYPVVLDPSSGAIEVLQPNIDELDTTGPGRPQPPGGGGKEQTEVTAPPFPPNKIPLALVKRSSEDNDQVDKDEVLDMRPPVSGTKFPPGVRFDKATDFAPRPTSPRTNRIRIRRGTLKSVALNVVAKKQEQFFRTVDLEFPARGQYDVRVKRVNSAGGDGAFDEVVYASLTAFRNDAPIPLEARKLGVSIIEVRARASENLEGVIDQFNCLATSVLQDWDGEDWVWRATDNPASVLRGILQGTGNPTPVPDSRLILEDFEAYHEWCEDRNFRFGQEVNFASNVLDLARDAAAIGRASIANADLKYGLAIDRAKSVHVTDFGPHTIIRDSLEVTLNYGPKLHGLRGRFRNRAKDYAVDEIVAYATGFDEASADPARIEALDLPGVTRAGHAGRYLQYRLADREQRRGKLYSFELGLQNLQIRVGDLVGLNSDVAFLGLGSGRVLATAEAGGNTTGVTLSSTVEMVFGTAYEARAVKGDGTLVALDVDTVPGESPVLTFTTPPLIADGPALDELVLFGELGKAVAPVVIRSIAPTSPYRARITAVDLAPAIFTIDGEPEPEFTSFVTIPPGLGRPAVLGVASDERAVELQHDGSYNLGILVALRQPVALAFAADRLEAQIRVKPEPDPLGVQSDEAERAEWTPLAPLSLDTVSVRFGAVRTGETYEMRFRYNGADGPGDWTATIEETVTGISALPPDVTDLRLVETRVAGVVRRKLAWLEPAGGLPRDFKDYPVRHRQGTVTSWDGMEDLPAKAIAGNEADISTIPRGVRTFAVRTRDVAGNLSANPRFLTVDLGDAPIDNIVFTLDEDTRGWPGAITGGTLSAGDIVADGDGGLYLANGAAPYLPDDGTLGRPDALYLPVEFSELTYQTTLTPGAAESPARLAVQVERIGEGLAIGFKQDSQDAYLPDGALLYLGGAAEAAELYLPGSADFAPFEEGQQVVHQAYTLRFTVPAGNVQGKILDLSFTLDVPDVTETLFDVSIPSGGARLAITKSYRVIKAVSPQLKSTSNAAVVRIVDRDPVLGPLLEGIVPPSTATAIVLDHVDIHGY